MKVKTTLTTQSRLEECRVYRAYTGKPQVSIFNQLFELPTRTYIRFPIFYYLLEFWKVSK